ncbi:MAG TPA: UpxY family transcription antiterminator [Acidobacteriota bacterium]|nr:UpxY family transcription antiterminator [Acidobacteriota bacterium]
MSVPDNMDAMDGEQGSALRWYAVHTRPRHEKVVAEQLCFKNIECFLPLREVLSKWKDRRKRVQFPLFPGYLFVHASLPSSRLDIIKVDSVVQILGFQGKPEPVPENQIDAVKRLVYSELPYDPYPDLAQGDRVRIVSGPLRGLEGVLVEKKNRFRFVLNVDLIRQSVACEIAAADVEKL